MHVQRHIYVPLASLYRIYSHELLCSFNPSSGSYQAKLLFRLKLENETKQFEGTNRSWNNISDEILV